MNIRPDSEEQRRLFKDISKPNEAEDYFDFIVWRIAFASGSYWMVCNFPSSQWYRIGFGFYWKQ